MPVVRLNARLRVRVLGNLYYIVYILVKIGRGEFCGIVGGLKRGGGYDDIVD